MVAGIHLTVEERNRSYILGQIGVDLDHVCNLDCKIVFRGLVAARRQIARQRSLNYTGKTARRPASGTSGIRDENKLLRTSP